MLLWGLAGKAATRRVAVTVAVAVPVPGRSGAEIEGWVRVARKSVAVFVDTGCVTDLHRIGVHRGVAVVAVHRNIDLVGA